MKKRVLMLILAVMTASFIAGCTKSEPKRKFKVLLRMMPLQYDYYVKEVIPAFEKENNCEISVVTFEESWKIEDVLKLDKEKDGEKIAVVKTPFEVTRDLAKKGYMSKLSTLVKPENFKQDKGQYHVLGEKLGTVDGAQYYFPRKLETRILVFLKSKVADAVANWKSFEADINGTLKAENGYGLPVGYELEADANKWDNFDVFVVGYFWANTKINDIKMPRIAHRAKRYEGTALAMVDRSYRMGASIDDIVKIDSTKVLDMFKWEAMFVKGGIYNPSMWEDMWSGSGIWNGFKDGKVFMAEMQQIDCFFLHGWADNPQMPGYVKDPSDLGFATIPAGVSLDVDAQGKPAYTGTKTNTTGGWWWGVPASSDMKDLGYKFIQYVTSKQVQAEEVARFGILPVRKDLVFKLPEVFSEGWVGEVFKTSSEQLKINEETVVPLIEDYPALANIYIGLWYDAIVSKYSVKNAPKVSDETIKSAIAETYGKKLSEIK